MNVKDFIKSISRSLPKTPIIQIDYTSVEMRVVESICGRCPVCNEQLFDSSVSGFVYSESHPFLLKSHLLKKNDPVHLVFEIMEL